jgi:hypothetical protein
MSFPQALMEESLSTESSVKEVCSIFIYLSANLHAVISTKSQASRGVAWPLLSGVPPIAATVPAVPDSADTTANAWRPNDVHRPTSVRRLRPIKLAKQRSGNMPSSLVTRPSSSGLEIHGDACGILYPVIRGIGSHLYISAEVIGDGSVEQAKASTLVHTGYEYRHRQSDMHHWIEWRGRYSISPSSPLCRRAVAVKRPCR